MTNHVAITEEASTAPAPSGFRCAALYSLFLIVLVAIGLQPHYEGVSTFGGNTDDVRATMFVSGVGVPGGPSDELLYSNRLIGRVLRSLYSTQPDVAWYGIYLTGCHLLAHLAICFAWCRVTQDWRIRFAVLVFLLGVGSYCWVALQFTTTSVLLALAGVSLIASAVLEEASAAVESKPRVGRVLTGWGCVLLAGLIRWKAMLLTGAVCVPLAVALAVCCGKRVAVVRHLLIAVFAIGLAFGLESWSQNSFDSSPAWREFRQFNQPRGDIVDNRHAKSLILTKADEPVSDETQRVLDEIGWSHNDARLCVNWFYFDEEVYSADSIRKASQAFSPGFPPLAEWLRTIVGISRVFVTDKVVLLLLLLSVSVAAAGSRWVCGFIVVVWLAAIVLTSGIYVFQKLPPHVLYPIASGAFLSSLAIALCGRLTSLPGENSAAPGMHNRFATLLMTITGVMALHQTHARYQATQEALGLREQFLQSVSQLDRGPDHIYVINLQFPFQRVSPYDTLSDWQDWRFLYTDGDTRSPRYNRFLRENGVEDLTTALYADPRVRLICAENRLPMLAEFLRAHRGVDVEWSVERKLPFLTVYRMTERPKEAG